MVHSGKRTYETNTIGFENESVNVDDEIEASNHFCCIDMVIDQAGAALTEKLIKELHFINPLHNTPM